jgi:hypothetical protein
VAMLSFSSTVKCKLNFFKEKYAGRGRGEGREIVNIVVWISEKYAGRGRGEGREIVKLSIGFTLVAMLSFSSTVKCKLNVFKFVRSVIFQQIIFVGSQKICR